MSQQPRVPPWEIAEVSAHQDDADVFNAEALAADDTDGATNQENAHVLNADALADRAVGSGSGAHVCLNKQLFPHGRTEKHVFGCFWKPRSSFFEVFCLFLVPGNLSWRLGGPSGTQGSDFHDFGHFSPRKQ